MPPNRMQTLSQDIAEQVNALTDFINSVGLNEPSFEDGVPKQIFSDPSSADRRMRLLELTDELHALLLGAEAFSSNFSWLDPYPSLKVIIKCGIHRAIPVESDGTPVEDIARTTAVSEDVVGRVLRLAATNFIFIESTPGHFRHTASSRALVENKALESAFLFGVGETLPAGRMIAESLEKWPSSEEPNECAWNLMNNTDKPIFEELQHHPDRAKNVSGAMRWLSQDPGFDVKYLLDSYPWTTLANRTFVDVGGSHGLIDQALARHVPTLKCIVQDRPEAIAEGKKLLPQDLSSRIELTPHDFFQEQPVKNADVYYYRLILHDWSDKYALKILHALIPALKPGAKVMVQEHLVPGHNELSKYRERGIRLMDIHMLAFQNAKERTVEDWKALFRRASSHFEFSLVSQPPGSLLGLVEFIWRP